VPDGTAQSETGRTGWLTTLGWAAYLACSWTWCIGMFLPVLLVRDYGVWGFVAFAVPNVVGAAAMGWLRPGVSEGIVREHGSAVLAFSIVTIAFQMFFLCWVFTWIPIGGVNGMLHLALWLSIIVLTCVFLLKLRPHRFGALIGAAAVLLFTVAAFALSAPGLLSEWRQHPLGNPVRPVADLFWLAPVMAFGFGLCPYLDATFHRVRRSTAAVQSRQAFGIGFGVFFLTCILFTLAYMPSIWRVVRSGTGIDTSLELLLVVYLAMQVVFTVQAHFLEGVSDTGFESRPSYIVVVIVAGALGANMGTEEGLIRGLLPAEFVYRLFMSFYGLVFPAYVWVCMIPTRDGHSGPSRDKVVVWIAAVVVAAPMFWMGFIERRTVWLVPGLAVVLLSRAVVMWRRASVGAALAVTGGPGHDGGGGGRTVS
jgi:hypothetical protein